MAMLDDVPVNVQDWESVEDSCWVCEGLFGRLYSWVDRCLERLSDFEFSTFLVGTKLSGRLAENEEILWAESKTTSAEPLKSELNRELGKRIELLTCKKVEFTKPDILVIVDLARDKVELHVAPLFLYGRYKKYVRGIPQTKWLCRECRGKGCPKCDSTGKTYPESVQELIGTCVLETSLGKDVIFHGAGREDVDALMLGNGRPFVLEVRSPRKRHIDLKKLELAINTSQQKVAVADLAFVDRETVARVKNARSDKVYRLKVVYEHPIQTEKLRKALQQLEGEVEQITPQRVVHRRTELKRHKKVYSAELKGGDIIIRCEGGLYVKELISGDEQRTVPSLSALLGVNAKVKELDVLEVCGGL
jgi:tRNA pseudouridine synthase 10